MVVDHQNVEEFKKIEEGKRRRRIKTIRLLTKYVPLKLVKGVKKWQDIKTNNVVDVVEKVKNCS